MSQVQLRTLSWHSKFFIWLVVVKYLVTKAETVDSGPCPFSLSPQARRNLLPCWKARRGSFITGKLKARVTSLVYHSPSCLQIFVWWFVPSQTEGPKRFNCTTALKMRFEIDVKIVVWSTSNPLFQTNVVGWNKPKRTSANVSFTICR